LTKLVVTPSEAVLFEPEQHPAPGRPISDRKDVTNLAVYELTTNLFRSHDGDIREAAGETIIVRYLDHGSVRWRSLRTAHFAGKAGASGSIDVHVFARSGSRMTPSAMHAKAAFVRRAISTPSAFCQRGTKFKLLPMPRQERRLLIDYSRRIRRALGGKWSDLSATKKRSSIRRASICSMAGFANPSPPASRWMSL
jgi:hypothetical protein